MEQRLANTWRMTVNEKKFIETALRSELRVDGRGLYDYRDLTIKFGREDGSSEVHLGQTYVLGFVTSQLVQPYRDRPNEGTVAIFTEFSPMADPSFEAGRPGESAVELGRIIDRGLRESRAVDTESLCVISGKFVWSIRIDLHILDNGGNLVDAANIAALAALLTFRRPECTLGGEDGQEMIVHPPEVREPLPLIIHHLPIAVTFAFSGEESMVVIDPTYFEEAVMGGRMTTTLNSNGDVCAIQKAGGVGIMQSVIMQCLRIASMKAADITWKIKEAVDSYNAERVQKKIKRHPVVAAVDVGEPSNLSRKWIEKTELKIEQCGFKRDNMDVCIQSSKQEGTNKIDGKIKNFIGALASWDPYSEGINSDELKVSLASQGTVAPTLKPRQERYDKLIDQENQLFLESDGAPSANEMAGTGSKKNENKTLEDAVKPKHRRKKASLND